jgi:hypothetical protein
MIRELAIGSILLIAQAVPAFAEIVPLACTNDSDGTTEHIVFDTDARTVLETNNHTYPMTMTDLQVTWQFTDYGFSPTGLYLYWTYNRNSGKLTESRALGISSSSFTMPAGNFSFTCTGWQKP